MPVVFEEKKTVTKDRIRVVYVTDENVRIIGGVYCAVQIYLR